jgi:hypothetical protein
MKMRGVGGEFPFAIYNYLGMDRMKMRMVDEEGT